MFNSNQVNGRHASVPGDHRRNTFPSYKHPIAKYPLTNEPARRFSSQSWQRYSSKFFVPKGNNHELINNILKRLNFEESPTVNGDVDFRWVGSIHPLLNHGLDYGDLINHVIGEGSFTSKLNLFNSIKSLERVRALANVQLPETIPETFLIDSKRDRERLVRTCRDNEFWITKPANGSRGNGISLLTSREELLDLIRSTEEDIVKRFFVRPQQRIVQKYITNSLLINGRKFDIRAYMLVASTTPLIVLHHPGYARLSLNQYSSIDRNIITHLTNQCVQMKDSSYEMEKENTAWSMSQVNEYVNTHFQKDKNIPVDWVLNVLPKIERQIMLRVIESVRARITRKIGCFGLYGVDFLIDDNFHVWLLEVNMGPALITNTAVLKEVIPPVVETSIQLSIECYDKAICGKDILPLTSQSDFQIVYAEKTDRNMSFDHHQSVGGSIHAKKRRQQFMSMQRLNQPLKVSV